ncbi:transglycosylase SLT domain-containing protein [Fodinibius salsisoli]|uniref:Transglycosylase SLT domain-containing protein n=1 Tax=Fodinibius salsisoli TaxID=2820877 RepID=A0ABT3PT60_9BACT|nr:transglycosylase SLT domain-containing protein [Fodinibius salsisoli]MCW9709056.1 transglycosylase SLT domain-containing protein [Fodinibius salsisoli]
MTNSFSISAELTYARIRGLMGYFADASRRYGVPLTLLLAVASRESRMGLALAPDGTGDHGNGIGIMQIDKRHHPNFTDRHSHFDHQANIDYGAQYLAKLLQQFNGNTTRAVAAYNAGPNKVRTAIYAGLPPDSVTTGKDYSQDVLERKQLIVQLLGLSKATSLSIYVLPMAAIAFATYNYMTTQHP